MRFLYSKICWIHTHFFFICLFVLFWILILLTWITHIWDTVIPVLTNFMLFAVHKHRGNLACNCLRKKVKTYVFFRSIWNYQNKSMRAIFYYNIKFLLFYLTYSTIIRFYILLYCASKCFVWNRQTQELKDLTWIERNDWKW